MAITNYIVDVACMSVIETGPMRIAIERRFNGRMVATLTTDFESEYNRRALIVQEWLDSRPDSPISRAYDVDDSANLFLDSSGDVREGWAAWTVYDLAHDGFAVWPTASEE